jgi:hypothetical protein
MNTYVPTAQHQIVISMETAHAMVWPTRDIHMSSIRGVPRSPVGSALFSLKRPRVPQSTGVHILCRYSFRADSLMLRAPTYWGYPKLSGVGSLIWSWIVQSDVAVCGGRIGVLERIEVLVSCRKCGFCAKFSCILHRTPWNASY